MKMRMAVLSASALMAMSSLTAGQEMKHGMMGMKDGCMQMMDSDGDGAISKDEFLEGHEKIFVAMDSDGDGSLGMQERKMGMRDMMGMDGGCPGMDIQMNERKRGQESSAP